MTPVRLAFLLVLLLALLALACTQKEAEELATEFPEFFEINSDDGSLVLRIPTSLVTDEVREITIATVPDGEAPEVLANLSGSGTVYRIQPFGMTFDQPVQAALRLDLEGLEGFPMSGADAYGLAGLNAEGERQLLNDLSTDYSLGEAFLTTFGTTDTVPEFIGRTKGSLRAEMAEIGTLPVGEGAAVDFTLRNAARAEDGVTLKGAVGDALADGAVSITVEPEGEPKDLAAGDSAEDDFDILCADEPGTGVYTLVASATSLVEGGSPSGVPLRIVLDSTVECVEGEAATPTEPPAGEDLGFPEGLGTYLANWGIPETLQTLVAFTEDAAGDHFYSDPSQQAGFTPESTDLSGVFAATVEVSEEAALTIEDLYPCGEVAENGVETLCQFPAATIPPGGALIIGGTLYGDFPPTPDRPCTLAGVFDAPGSPWQPNAPFSDDLYKGAGTWYEVRINPDGVGVVSVSHISTAQEITPGTSQGRFFIDRTNRSFGAIVPATEVSGASGYRTTTFCGDQFFTAAQSGGDVAPGARPTEFRQLPTDVIPLQQICGGTCVGRGPRERIL